MKYHKNMSKEQRTELSKKLSNAQKGKKYFINIITKEIRLIYAKDLDKYDIGTTWIRCHKDGTIWQD